MAVTTGVLDQVLQEFMRALLRDYGRIESLSMALFYYLAGIQLAVSAIWMMFRGNLQDAVVRMIQVFVTLSVFYTLVLFGGKWMPQLINGFISIGADSSGISSLTPSSVMAQGISIGFAILDNFSDWGWVTHPFGSLLAFSIMISIVILYALLAAEMAIVLVKSYLLVTLSGLMFAFGASDAMRPIAINYLRAVIGVGLQLLVFYLIMGVGVRIGQDWAHLVSLAANTHQLKPFLVVMAAAIVFYMIVKNVPPFVAGLSGVGGFRSYGDSAAVSALTAGGVGARALSRSSRAMGQAGFAGAQVGSSFIQGARGGLGIPRAMGQAASHAVASAGGAIRDSVMRGGRGSGFVQKFSEGMASRAVANSPGKGRFASSQQSGGEK